MRSSQGWFWPAKPNIESCKLDIGEGLEFTGRLSIIDLFGEVDIVIEVLICQQTRLSEDGSFDCMVQFVPCEVWTVW